MSQVTARALQGSELGAFLRHERLHDAQVLAWRAAAEAALAETAALLVLIKEAQAIWGDADDTTDARNGSRRRP